MQKDVIMKVQECPHFIDCWQGKGVPQRSIPPWMEGGLPMLYRGKNYDGNVLGIGLNLHEYGGHSALKDLIDGDSAGLIGVKNQLKNGKVKIFKKDNYGGTYLFHRLAAYSIILSDLCHLEQERIVTVNGKFLQQDYELLPAIYDQIAYTEAVKCSPEGNRSAPTSEMMMNCPVTYLQGEIDVLKPKKIICFSSDISGMLKAGKKDAVFKTEKISVYKIENDKESFFLFRIIHPSAQGGNDSKIFRQLYDINKELNEDS